MAKRRKPQVVYRAEPPVDKGVNAYGPFHLLDRPASVVLDAHKQNGGALPFDWFYQKVEDGWVKMYARPTGCSPDHYISCHVRLDDLMP